MILYVMIAAAGWRTICRMTHRSSDAALVGTDDPELYLVAGVFTLHYIALALAIILTLFAVIVSFVWVQWRENRLAAMLFIPYAAWVAFASLLNCSIYRLN